MSGGLTNPINGITGSGGQLDVIKTNAHSAVDTYIDMSGTNSVRRNRAFMDERKLRQAEMFKSGVEGDYVLITEEAKYRGIDVGALADVIIENAKKADDIELWRIQMKLAINKAPDRSSVIALLTEQNIPIQNLPNIL